MKKILTTALILIGSASFGQKPGKAEVHRIGDYGRLWSVLKLFHPAMAYGQINEDSLFTENIGELLSDPSAANFKTAVKKMLDQLQDPYTAIEDTSKHAVNTIALPARPLLKWYADSIACVYLDNNFVGQNVADNGADKSILQLIDSLKNAHGIIVDLRRSSDQDMSWDYLDCVEKLFSYLTDKDLSYPLVRTRIHYGHESQGWDMSSFYYQGWFLHNPYVVNKRQKSIQKPVCLLINRVDAFISSPVAAMQQNNTIVIADDSLDNKFDQGSSYPMKIADGLQVNINTGETVYSFGKVFSPDTIIRRTTGVDSVIIKTAIGFLQRKDQVIRLKVAPLSNRFVTPKVEGYDSLAYPPAPLRLIGLMRYWSAINYFCPNKDRIPKNWDSVLYEYVPRFLGAKDSLEYTKVVAQLITEIRDGHGWLGSKVWEKLHYSIPDLQVKYIGNKSIVYKIYNDSLKRSLSVGDEILKVDSIAVNKVRSWFAQYKGASNDAALQRGVSQDLLSGPDGTKVSITFLHNGTVKNLQLKRNRYIYSSVPATKVKEEPVWKKINNKTGYVDFGRLEVAQIDTMFNDLKNTDQIILDNRSYPRGTVWTLINYLTDKPVISAMGTTMVADSPDPFSVMTQNSLWQIPVTPNGLQYKGRIIILVNETTQSQAEYSCMVLQAASRKITIIGSQTAGADGDVTGIKFPGGIQTAFSGHGIHYPDGRPTQGIGIVPDIKISPTISGIRQGRDEVLERAIQFAATGK